MTFPLISKDVGVGIYVEAPSTFKMVSTSSYVSLFVMLSSKGLDSCSYRFTIFMPFFALLIKGESYSMSWGNLHWYYSSYLTQLLWFIVYQPIIIGRVILPSGIQKWISSIFANCQIYSNTKIMGVSYSLGNMKGAKFRPWILIKM